MTRVKANDEHVPLILRLPGLRRYGARLGKLRAELRRAKKEIHALRTAYEQGADDRALLEQAKRYRYYWGRAFKTLDIRDLVPFGPLAARVIGEDRTFLDVDRLYTLWQSVQMLPATACAVAEVGTYKGGSARFIAEALRLCGREMPLYVCDTFHGHAAVDDTIDGGHQPHQQFTVKIDKVLEYLKPYECIRVVQGDFRETASELAMVHDFGFVHVDVDVYPMTRFCLEFFAPRIVPRGVIIVDDYGTKTCRGVTKAVDEFARADPNFRVLHLLSGQAVLIHAPANP